MKKFIILLTSIFAINISFSNTDTIIVQNDAGKDMTVVHYNPDQIRELVPTGIGFKDAFEFFDELINNNSMMLFSLPSGKSGVVNVKEGNYDLGNFYIGGITAGSNQNQDSCCKRFWSCLGCCVSNISSVAFNGCKITNSSEENAEVRVSIGAKGDCTCLTNENCQKTSDPVGISKNSSIKIVSNSKTNDIELKMSNQMINDDMKEEEDDIR